MEQSALTYEQIEDIKQIRHLARTDAYYLATEILGFKLIDRKVHGPVFKHLTQFGEAQGIDNVSVDKPWQYVPLNRDPLKVPSLAKDVKRRLLLDPRGWFKTTINVITHTTQWILNFPDIAIYVIHGNQDLSEELTDYIRTVIFTNNQKMRYAFPEFCCPINPRSGRPISNWGNQSEFTVPCRKVHIPSPTVKAGSIGGQTAGQHFHVMKFTDVVNEQNSETPDQLQKVCRRFDMFENLLINIQYWIDVEGTCYDYEDLYNGEIIARENKLADEDKTWQIFVRGCFQKKLPQGQVEEHTPEEREYPDLIRCSQHPEQEGRFEQPCPVCGEKMLPVSRFEQHEPARDLVKKMKGNPHQFATQKKNNPADVAGQQKAFPSVDLVRADQRRPRLIVPLEEVKRIPFRYYTMSVDLAETVTKRADFTAMNVIGWTRHNEGVVVDGLVGKFLTDDLAKQMVEMYQKWKCMCLKIEESSFNRGLYPTLRRREDQTGLLINYDWIKRESNEPKKQRIMGIQEFWKIGLIKFSSGLDPNFLEHLATECNQFPSQYAHDDILDSLSDQFQNKEDYFDLGPRLSAKEQMEKAEKMMYEKTEQYKEIYGFNLDRETNHEALWEKLGAL